MFFFLQVNVSVDFVVGFFNMVFVSLEDLKVEDLVIFDIIGKSFLVDYMVIVFGWFYCYVGVIVDYLLCDIKVVGYGFVIVEGQIICDWVLIDVGDVIVYIFCLEVCGFYNLEKMWVLEMDEVL